MAWTTNSIMYWFGIISTSGPGNTAQYRQVSDHNRGPLNVDIERIGNDKRMVDGTMRRHTVVKKRKWSTSWEVIPHKTGVSGALTTADGGLGGADIEAFHNLNDGAFNMQLRDGDGTIEVVTVMITDFSKEIKNRGKVDYWNVSVTLEEV